MLFASFTHEHTNIRTCVPFFINMKGTISPASIAHSLGAKAVTLFRYISPYKWAKIPKKFPPKNPSPFVHWKTRCIWMPPKIIFLVVFYLVKLNFLQGYYKDTVEFYFDDRNQCKNFWKKCVEHHSFFRCSSSMAGEREKHRILSRGSSFR